VTAIVPETSGLVRLRVLGPDRQADLVVPARLPVADLLPDLARAVGVLDPSLVYGGYRLVRPDGTVLDPSRDLATQSVPDGSVVTVEVGAHDPESRSYDDVVEAVADAVEASTRPWTPEAGRRSALAAATLLLGIASAALGLERADGAPVAAAAAILAVLLLTGAAVLARAQDAPEAAAVVAWLSVPPAAVSGLAAAPDDPLGALPLLLAGLFGLAAGLLGLVALRQLRPALLPPLGLCLLAAAVGGFGVGTDLEPAAVVAVALVLAVLLGAVAPALAVVSTRIRTPSPDPAPGPENSGEEVDPAEIGGAVGTGRAMLLGLTATTAVLVVAGAPFLVHLGVSGLLLGVAVGGLLLLACRRSRAWSDVAVGLGGGTAGLTALGLSAALVHPEWRTALAGVLVAVGVVLLLVSRAQGRSRLWVGRVGDVAEALAVLATIPLVVLAIGLVSAVRS
jgi:type VII secretion integral membrane protein EccD